MPSQSKSKRSTTNRDTGSGDLPQEETLFPIVAIGASAGGLEAMEEFFTQMPPDNGMGFVVVQHLDPSHRSILVELVKRCTRMSVEEATEGVTVKPNSVYVIPPNRDLTIQDGLLHLKEPRAPRGLRMPIDTFFRSLAVDRGEFAVCIVLSGTGTEGTLGLKAVKGEGGLVLIQEPETAQYDGMPRSAVATGLADLVLRPVEMPEQLIRLLHPKTARDREPTANSSDTRPMGQLQKVFSLLRSRTGHDFSGYKQSTILRRIDRRVVIHHLAGVPEYVKYLKSHPDELDTLLKELLIEVTSFFRDPRAYEALRTKALPDILTGPGSDLPLRVWVPACSTGEEAYSLAILLLEALDERGLDRKIQIFATDVNANAIETARKAVYPMGVATDLSTERLRRFFLREQDGYRVKQNVRDMVVFSEQSVIRDPPFSKLDLISCRNLLIYLGPEIQHRLLGLFHYALNPGGYLFLGTSETVGSHTELFQPVDRKWKLYQRKGLAIGREAALRFSHPFQWSIPAPSPSAEIMAENTKIGLKELTERMILRDFAPAAVLINEKCEILYVHGRTGKYLEPATGTATLSLLAMAREGLRMELATAVSKALAESAVVRKDGLQVRTNGGFQAVTVVVSPVTTPPAMHGLSLVVFSDVGSEENAAAKASGTELKRRKSKRAQELERELNATKEYLQATIEELETSNEELKSTNEELQSANEELQSTNEELETSKEELQSVNEELNTVNTELENKIEELSRANDDLNNFLAGTESGSVFLDTELHVKRFTPAATQVLHLIATDIDRPLQFVATKFEAVDLAFHAGEVLRTLTVYDSEVQTKDGFWYRLRIQPYRTTKNVIEGVVITLADITDWKAREMRTQQAEQRANRDDEALDSVFQLSRDPLLLLDAAYHLKRANDAFFSAFSLTPQVCLDQSIFMFGDGCWDVPELHHFLEELLPQQGRVDSAAVELATGRGERCRWVLHARHLASGGSEPQTVLLALPSSESGSCESR